ncbi:hypothetical protein EES45_01925 [Streptomyces sp. ADI97-07]|nr:hypothetical protein EES45_01925 [Streptomyces sp. ADI97-07]
MPHGQPRREPGCCAERQGKTHCLIDAVQRAAAEGSGPALAPVLGQELGGLNALQDAARRSGAVPWRPFAGLQREHRSEVVDDAVHRRLFSAVARSIEVTRFWLP